MERSEQAVAKFAEGYNCAQSVLFSFCEDLGLDKDKALKIGLRVWRGHGQKRGSLRRRERRGNGHRRQIRQGRK